MYAVIAQGCAYYGSAFFTICDLSFSDIRMRLSKVPEVDVAEEDRKIFLQVAPDTSIQILPWQGSHQQMPVILFDGGHGKLDLEALEKVKTILETPYVPDEPVGQVKESRPATKAEIDQLKRHFNG